MHGVDPEQFRGFDGLGPPVLAQRAGDLGAGPHLTVLAVGREDEHDPGTAVREQPHRAAGEDRLVVGVGVEEDDGGAHRLPARRG